MRFLIILITCIAFLTSCQERKRSAPKEIHLNLNSEPATLDPRKGGDIISSHMHFLLFEGLVRLQPDHSITPAQAESFERSSDGLQYTFHIRDTLWSNGTPVVAQDFEKAWKAMLDPHFPSPNAHLLYPIKNAEAAKKGDLPLKAVGIKSVNNKTLVVTLEKPTPYFLELISFCVFFPVCSQIDETHPDWAYHANEHFVCNGPFTLDTWQHHHKLIAKKNPLYWDVKTTNPEWIHFSMIGDEMTALQLFEQGGLDMVGDPLSPLPAEAIPALKNKGVLHTQPVGGTTLITFNINTFPFHNQNIRKAFAYAIDRQSLVENVLQTDALPALNAVPPILKKGYNHAFFEDANTQKAHLLFEQGLEELGLSRETFPTLTYLYSQSDKHHKTAQALQQQWKTILGIDVHLENMEFKVLMDRLSKHSYQFGQTIWAAQYSDPMNILERFKSAANCKNYPGWENNTYIELLENSFYAQGDERLQILEEAEALFLEEMPVCPLYHWDMTYITPSHLHQVELSPIGDLVFTLLSKDQPAHNQ